MIFVPYYKLKAGMKVANDISLSNKEKSRTFLLKQGAILTQDNIDKLSNFNISGVYIDDGRKNPILDENLRKESVLAVKEIFNLPTIDEGQTGRKSGGLSNIIKL